MKPLNLRETAVFGWRRLGLWASLYANVNQKSWGGDTLRKSFWLISARMAALATPSFAPEPAPPVAAPTPTPDAASVDEGVQHDGGAPDTADNLVTAHTRTEPLAAIPLARPP